MKTKFKFTDAKIKSLKPLEERYEVWDETRPAFGLRVGKTGKKSWIFVYHYHGRARRITLGNYPQMPLTEARSAYEDAHSKLSRSIDPGDQILARKEQEMKDLTVQALGNLFIEKHSKQNKKSWVEDQRILEHDILPAWGKRQAKSIDREHVLVLINSIADRAPIQANRTLSFVRKLFNWAVQNAILDSSSCVNVRAPSKENRRDHLLNMNEVQHLLDVLKGDGISETGRNALIFLLLTAQRAGEVVQLKWCEIDWDDEVWTLPGKRTKNGRTNHIPLSKGALEVLREQRDANPDNEWVFPSPKQPAKPITRQALNRALRRLRDEGILDEIHPHDLRRTAASHMARLGVNRYTIEKLLNHVDRSVTAIYDRYDHEKEKREAVELWARELGLRGV